MPNNNFAGDKKEGKPALHGLEENFKKWATPKIPKYIETYHLTRMTLIWSVFNIYFGYLAIGNLNWLWGVSIMIVLQYITDVLDGNVGKTRNTGLVKRGFYMDHFLDYIFLCSLVTVGYLISPSGLEIWYFILLIIMGGFMINSFLSFAATNKFEIYHYGFGPTEARIGIIIINTIIIFGGTKHFIYTLPLTVIISGIVLGIYTYKIHKNLRGVDMKEKEKSSQKLS